MSPVEKAARAIFDIEHPPVEGIAWEELSAEVEQAYYLDLARAVLQAIREPSPAMVSAAVHAAERIGPHDHVGVFAAMIDKALSE